MKKRIIILIVCLLAVAAFAGPTAWNITQRPDENWFSGSVSDPAWNWMKDIEGLVGGSTNIGTGKIFYVDSGLTTAGNGTSWNQAVATLDEAINLCTADRGDIIYVAQGHAETMGTGSVDADVAGISIIGLGTGELRPRFSYDTATDTFLIGADDVHIENLYFYATVTAVAVGVNVEVGSENTEIINCQFVAETAGTDEFIDAIILAGTGTDGGIIAGCLFDSGPATNAGPQSAINFIDADNLMIVGNRFFGDCAVACIQNETTASNFITIRDNILYNGIIGASLLNAQPCIELVATTTGSITGNVLYCDVATPDLAIVGADMMLADNYYSELEATSNPPMWLTTDSLENKIGVDDAANLGTTVNVTADADGSILERLEQLEQYLNATDTKAGQQYASTMTSTMVDDDMFDVDGGAILITSIVGVVTTQSQDQANAIEITLDADVGFVDYDLSTAVETTGDVAGTRYVISAVNEGVFTPLEGADAGANILSTGLFCGEGMIELNAAQATHTGAIKWFITWVPYEDGTTVTAQ